MCSYRYYVVADRHTHTHKLTTITRGLADVYGCLIGGLSEAPLIGHLIAGWRPLVATVLKLALQLNLLHGSSWREVYMHVVWVAASIRAV